MKFNRLVFVTIVLVAGVSLHSCYYFTQGSVLIRHRNQAQPLDRALEDNPSLSSFFSRVEEIRDYGSKTLQLNIGKSFSRYLEVENDFLVAVVNAAPPSSLEPYLWRYPFFGPAPYRGYYNPENALAEAKRLREKGFEVWVRRVDAFSTLGVTRDPLISFMKSYSEFELARLIFHEQIHATLWIKGDIQFNEELASALSEVAALEFIGDSFGTNSAEYREAEFALHNSTRFARDMASLAEELDSLYLRAEEESWKEPRIQAQKSEIYETFKTDFRENYSQNYRGEGFLAVADIEINNAFVSLYRTYTGRSPAYVKLYNKLGSVSEVLEALDYALSSAEYKGMEPFEILQRLAGTTSSSQN